MAATFRLVNIFHHVGKPAIIAQELHAVIAHDTTA